MEGMNIGFFINIRKEVDCKDNRFKNEESYVYHFQRLKNK